jgi:hypothetical protein
MTDDRHTDVAVRVARLLRGHLTAQGKQSVDHTRAAQPQRLNTNLAQSQRANLPHALADNLADVETTVATTADVVLTRLRL